VKNTLKIKTIKKRIIKNMIDCDEDYTDIEKRYRNDVNKILNDIVRDAIVICRDNNLNVETNLNGIISGIITLYISRMKGEIML
jgi:hypothetical protein